MKKEKTYTIDDLQNQMAVSSDERETSINWMFGDDKFTLFTSDQTIITKIRKLMPSGEWKLLNVDVDADGIARGYIFEAPLRALSFRTGKKMERTEEQKELFRERMAAGRKAQS